MVSVVPLHSPDQRGELLDSIGQDLAQADRDVLVRALEFAEPLYAGHTLSTGEAVWPHALGLAVSLAAIGMDAPSRASGILFAAPKYLAKPDELREKFGAEIASLAAGVEKLYQLRVSTRPGRGGKPSDDEQEKQSEVLRKMVLAMVEDIRVVLIRLASRTQTLRFFAKNPNAERESYAQESLDIYAPLANRLGMWQLKWEIEDLSLRFIDAEGYKRVAQMLDEKRAEREAFIQSVTGQLARELESAGVHAQIQGRPKHIFSIYNKMRAKDLAFSEIFDVRAVRVIVDSLKDCYSALGIVHNLWTPIPQEFDDYISRPKANLYRSLHTAVIGPDGRALEVQIRTQEMHQHAEFGVAAHWRYKEAGAGSRAEGAFDEKIAWLRQLLAWRDEVADSAAWVEQFKQAALDDTVYVMTPQGRVIDLPAGSTPIDFAYALHTDLGHHCRGAKVDGHMVPLDTPLKNGQRVEIVSAKVGGPSRDWLNAELGYLKSHRARQKVRQWFNNQALADTVATGRAIVEREMNREGEGRAKLDTLAATLGFAKPDDLFAAAARDEVNLRQIQVALRTLVRGEAAPAPVEPAGPAMRKPKAGGGDSGILIVGIDHLLTQLAGCCKPVPPDPIRGFVTRGRGVSIHREDCPSFHNLADKHPERVIDADWGAKNIGAFSVDMVIVAADRQGLLRDVGEALAREKINVTAVNTQSKQDLAYMRFTCEVADLDQLRRAISVVKDVSGVLRVSRG
ncbi:MAG: bifunctional (p)ppGpp synthetase/guanosine-3',5'-bis(diphosphate) 3'-pyrophosphohydrolase [Proteobacteria bacterium]|nr:bifunctional (p)ppGpp synthetase/guanosine-3',5'-bis(diphosphate) 3'-pyrophosphohydrolase [Pseudomonadota bacterium]